MIPPFRTSSPQFPRLLVGIYVALFLVGMVWSFTPWFLLRKGMFVSVGRAYWFGTIVTPAVLLASLPVMIALHRRTGTREWRRPIFAFAAIGALLVAVRVWTNVIEPGMLVVREVTIRTPKLTREVRLLHISDFQSAQMGAYEERAFAKMRDLNPDLILHTGDLLQPYPGVDHDGEWAKLVALWNTLEAPLGKFNVVGDVDWRWNKQLSQPDCPIRTLEGTDTTIDVDGRKIRILGLPLDQTHHGHEAMVPVHDWFKTTSPDEFTIVMGHGPDFVEAAETKPIDLCLAGHTHGGQIRIPFFGPTITFSSLPRELARGFHEVGQTRLNVSAGVGGEHSGAIPTIRLNCPSEMTMIRLVPGQCGVRRHDAAFSRPLRAAARRRPRLAGNKQWGADTSARRTREFKAATRRRTPNRAWLARPPGPSMALAQGTPYWSVHRWLGLSTARRSRKRFGRRLRRK